MRVAAETLAAQMVLRAVTNAVAVDVSGIADLTGLTRREVEAVRDRVLSGKREHRADVDAATRHAAAACAPWTKAGNHPVKAIARKHGQILALIAEVEAAMVEHAQREQAKAKREALLRELAKLDEATGDLTQCPECPARMSVHGLAIHRARKHGVIGTAKRKSLR